MNKKTFNRLLILLTLFSVVFIGCKHKKTNLQGDAPVKVNDFMAAFSPIILPFTVADSNIHAFEDTLSIGHFVFGQFVPDSILGEIVNTEKKYSIHPVGRFEKEKETYLIVNITQKKKTQVVVVAFDKKSNTFLAAKTLINDGEEDGYIHSLSINKEPTFTVGKEKIDPQTKQLVFTHVGWIYNTAGIFMVIVNDTNEDIRKVGVILNPIDTLPRKNKLSGEYATDKKNFISIRDGKDANTYQFFIHFEKKEGACVGELKGILQMKSSQDGIYSQGGDPCIIDFNFEGNEVTLKEKGSCGNRRGMDCFFDDTFVKKRGKK